MFVCLAFLFSFLTTSTASVGVFFVSVEQGTFNTKNTKTSAQNKILKNFKFGVNLEQDNKVGNRLKSSLDGIFNFLELEFKVF